MKKVLFVFFISIIFISCKEITQGIIYIPSKETTQNTVFSTVFFPDEQINSNVEVPVLVLVHGGAYYSGSRNDMKSSAENIIRNTSGIAVATLDYRFITDSTSPTCFDILDDITLGLKEVKDTLTNNNYKTNKAALFGFSAGAQLSMLYSFTKLSDSPFNNVFCASLSGPTDFTNSFYYGDDESLEMFSTIVSLLTDQEITKENYSTSPYKESLKEISPINYISSSSIPLLFAHGRYDTIVPYENATDLKQKLDDNNVRYDFFSFENSGHNLDSELDSSTNDLFYQKLAVYLENYF